MNKVKLEALIKENPAAAAAAAMTTVMLMNKDTGRKNKATTALRDRDNPSHEKAVGIFQKLRDKFTQKKKEKSEKQRKADIDVALKKMGITPKEETIAMKSRTDKELGETKMMKLETLLKENPAAMAAMQKMTALKLQGKGNRKVQAVTALKDKEHPSHEKAVSIFQKIKDKFSKKKEDEPKKQSQSDADFYRKQYAARTGKELDESVKMHTISGNQRFMTKTAIPIIRKYGIKNMKANTVGGYFLELRFLIDSNKLKELDKELKRKNKTAYGGIVENRRDKMTEDILRKVIREEIKKMITEDEGAFDQPIPAGIERYMKKFIAAVQGAKLNRRRTAAILGRVVAAMNIEPGDLMKYVRMVKKGL